MSQFDPYSEWLNIDTKSTLLHYYSLLGLEDFCADPLRIADAADKRMAIVRRHHLGARADASQQLLNQLAAAKVTLLGADSKQKYDNQLQGWLANQPSGGASATATPQAPTHALEEEVAPAGFAGFDDAPAPSAALPTGFAAAATSPAVRPVTGEPEERAQPIIGPQMASFLNAYLVPMIWGSVLFMLMAIFVMLILFRSDKQGDVVEQQGSDANVDTDREIVIDKRQVLKLPAGVALQNDEGDVMLDVANAQLTGSAQLTGEFVSGITSPEDTLTWEFHVLKPGIFQPVVTYACDTNSAGGEYKLTAGPAKVWTKVRDTGGFETFSARKANKKMLLKPAGRHTLTLSAAEVPGTTLMNVLSVELQRNASGTMSRN